MSAGAHIRTNFVCLSQNVCLKTLLGLLELRSFFILVFKDDFSASFLLLFCFFSASFLLLFCFFSASFLLLFCFFSASFLLLFCFFSASFLLLFSFFPKKYGIKYLFLVFTNYVRSSFFFFYYFRRFFCLKFPFFYNFP